MLGLLSTLYLHICVFLLLSFLHLTHGNIIFDILEFHAVHSHFHVQNLKNLKKWLAALPDLY